MRTEPENMWILKKSVSVSWLAKQLSRRQIGPRYTSKPLFHTWGSDFMRVLMLATTAAMIEQFNKNNIELLESLGYEVHVAGNFEQGNPITYERLEEFKKWIGEHNGKWFHIPSTRKPNDLRNNCMALKIVIKMINEYHYDFIHCHTPIGSVIGRIAARKTHTKIIYTAHGFHFYDGAPLKNWLIFYPIEKHFSRYTDVLITINK